MTQGEVTVPPSTAWHLKQLQISHAFLTSLSLHSPAELSARQGCICKRPAWPVSWTCRKRTCKTGMKHRSAVLFGIPKQRNKQILPLRSGWYIWRPPPSSQLPDQQLQYPRKSKQPHQVRQGSWCPTSSSGISQRRPQGQKTHAATLWSSPPRKLPTSRPEPDMCLCI